MGAKVAVVAESASEAATLRAKTNAIAPCPTCKRPMSRETFRGIEVDRCRDHGIWFDRDEVLHVLRGTRPETLKGLGGAASGAASAATAAAILGRPANLSGEDAVDLADVGLEAAAVAIHANVEASDAAAWMVVDLVAGLFDRESSESSESRKS